MDTSSVIPDDAIVLRHIPGGTTFQQPPEHRITSRNFQLRPEEDGVSVSLSSPFSLGIDAGGVLRRFATSGDSKVGFASLSAIRNLGFGIVFKPTPDDPQHAIIVSGTRDLSNHQDRKLLSSLFRYVSLPPT